MAEEYPQSFDEQYFAQRNIMRWWRAIELNRDEHAILRACRTPEEAANARLVHTLREFLPAFDDAAIGTIAAVLAEVDVDDGDFGLHPYHLEELVDCENCRDVLVLLRCRLSWVGRRADVEGLVEGILEWFRRTQRVLH